MKKLVFDSKPRVLSQKQSIFATSHEVMLKPHQGKHQIELTCSGKNYYDRLIERLGPDANPEVLEKLEIQSIKCNMRSA